MLHVQTKPFYFSPISSELFPVPALEHCARTLRLNTVLESFISYILVLYAAGGKETEDYLEGGQIEADAKAVEVRSLRMSAQGTLRTLKAIR